MAGSNEVQLQDEELLKKAALRAMKLLTGKDYTEKQLRDKLEQGAYPPHIIDAAVEYVKSFHYIDDRRYAGEYIQCHSADRPAMRIRNDLVKKGISREVIETAMRDFQDGEGLIDETQMIRRYLNKKKIDPKGVTFQEKQKICAALLQKGFQFEHIRSVLLLDIT